LPNDEDKPPKRKKPKRRKVYSNPRRKERQQLERRRIMRKEEMKKMTMSPSDQAPSLRNPSQVNPQSNHAVHVPANFYVPFSLPRSWFNNVKEHELMDNGKESAPQNSSTSKSLT